MTYGIRNLLKRVSRPNEDGNALNGFIAAVHLILLAFFTEITKPDRVISEALMKSTELCRCLQSTAYKTVEFIFEVIRRVVLGKRS